MFTKQKKDNLCSVLMKNCFIILSRFTTQDLNYIGDICVEFYYEAYGATVNELVLYVQLGPDYKNHTDIWQIHGEQGNVWKQQMQNVKATTLNTRVNLTFN